MATLVVTNLTSSPVYLRDLYCTVAANGTVTTTRYAAQLTAMDGLQALIAAGTVSATATYGAGELGSGTVGLGLPDTTATGTSPPVVVRVPITAGIGGGTADITVYPLGGLPADKVRVISAVAFISTAESTSTLTLYSSTGGSGGTGTLCGTLSSASTGPVQEETQTATVVLTNSSTTGLFVHQSNNLVVGEVFITLRPE